MKGRGGGGGGGGGGGNGGPVGGGTQYGGGVFECLKGGTFKVLIGGGRGLKKNLNFFIPASTHPKKFVITFSYFPFYSFLL